MNEGRRAVVEAHPRDSGVNFEKNIISRRFRGVVVQRGAF